MLLKDTIERYYRLVDFQRYLVNRYILRKFGGGLTCYDDENAIAVPDDFRKSIKFTCDLCGGYPIQLMDRSKGLSGPAEATNEFTQIVLRAENIRSYEDFEEILKRDVAADVKEDAQRAIARAKAEEQAKAQAAMRAKQAAEAVAATESQRRAEATRAKELYEQQMRRAEQSRMQAEQFAVATDQARKKAEEREYYLHAAVQQALAETEHNFKQERAKWKKERQSLQKKAIKTIATASIALVLAAAFFILFVVLPSLQADAKIMHIILEPNGGSLSASDRYREGEVGHGLTLPTPLAPTSGPFCDGYRFGGWCISSTRGNGIGDPTTWATFPDLKASSVVLYAKWEVDPVGASVLGAQADKTNISISGDQIIINLGQNDHNFNTTEESLNTMFVFSPDAQPSVFQNKDYTIPAPESVSLSVGGNTNGTVAILYLRVTSKDGAKSRNYTITIVRNITVEVTFRVEGLSQAYATVTVPSNSAVTPPASPSKVGYNFDVSNGWVFDLNNTGNSNTVKFDTFRPQINTSLYARFFPRSNTVMFRGNPPQGLTIQGSMLNQFVYTDDTVPLRECAYTLSGYNFKGWALAESGPVVLANKESLSWDMQFFNAKFGGSASMLFNRGTIELFAVWGK